MSTTPFKKPIQVGDAFGQWAVVNPDTDTRGGSRGVRLILCRCSCGVDVLVSVDSLRSGTSTRCLWCHQSARRVGVEYVPDPKVRERWLNCRRNMVDRCGDPGHHGFPNYGGRGITVCAALRDDPRPFLRWVATQQDHTDPEMTIERIDTEGGYGPGNCRLATREEQSRNRRSCRYVNHRNRRMTAAEFQRRYAWSLSETVVCRHVKNRRTAEWIIGRHEIRLAKSPPRLRLVTGGSADGPTTPAPRTANEEPHDPGLVDQGLGL